MGGISCRRGRIWCLIGFDLERNDQTHSGYDKLSRHSHFIIPGDLIISPPINLSYFCAAQALISVFLQGSLVFHGAAPEETLMRSSNRYVG